jgi:ATP-dependent protease ClpP protease subunit
MDIANNIEENKEEIRICFEHNNPGKTFHIYLLDEIQFPKEYINIIHTIKTASPHDIIYMYLNTPGGYLDTGVQLISAMRASQAHVITVLEGTVASLGALLFLCGDEFIVNPHILLMIHNHSGGQWGKGHEYLAKAEATAKWFETIARDVYRDFLTEDELKEMLDGKDFWLQTEDVKKRLERKIKAVNKRMKEKEKAEKGQKKK